MVATDKPVSIDQPEYAFGKRKFASLLVVVLIGGLCVWQWTRGIGFVATADPIESLDIELRASDYVFYFRHPGKDRLLHTADDRIASRDLVIPFSANVTLHLTSDDFAYTVEIPEYQIYEVATPDSPFQVSFREANAENRTLPLLGTQMCGYIHPELLGHLFVKPQAEYRKSVEELPTAK